MKVVLDGQCSESHSLNAGVPQGSVLGPTLFLIFINDLPDNILNSFIDIFADDSTLYESPNETNDTFEKVSENISNNLSSIVNWGKRWLVTFNATKTNSVIFHHHRQRQFVPFPRTVSSLLSLTVMSAYLV